MVIYNGVYSQSVRCQSSANCCCLWKPRRDMAVRWLVPWPVWNNTSNVEHERVTGSCVTGIKKKNKSQMKRWMWTTPDAPCCGYVTRKTAREREREGTKWKLQLCPQMSSQVGLTILKEIKTTDIYILEITWPNLVLLHTAVNKY